MSSSSTSRRNFDPLSSWEAPWNHMKYFWHNDPEPSDQDETRDPLNTETKTSTPCKQNLRRVHETNDGCKETRSIRPRREIIAMKPIPWRNVYPPTTPPLPSKIPCTCEAPKVQSHHQDKQQTNTDIRPKRKVLKFKKAPKIISYCTECVKRWKEDAANQAVADMFQSIRDAPTKKPPGRTCEGEFIIPTDYCRFCNQALSAFGFCNECLPPTPVPKPVVIPEQRKESKPKQSKPEQCKPEHSKPEQSKPEQNKPEQCKPEHSKPEPSKPEQSKPEQSKKVEEHKSENTCSGECFSSALPCSHFMDPCRLLHEINNLQPTYVPPESCTHSKSNNGGNIPLSTQMQSENMHNQLERDCQQGGFLQTNNFQNKVCDSCQISHVTKTDHFRSANIDQFPNTNPYYLFHHSKDCPYSHERQPESNNHSGQAVAQAMGSSGNPHSLYPILECFSSPESQRPQHRNTGRQGGTVAHFGVTLEVGNTSAQDITVVLYANRILVAEAVNFSANGEIVSAQSWALPNDVDVATLRCYLGDGKLYIVSFPPPPGFNWRFATYPAALGPPKFSNQPCPFEP